MAAQYHLPFSEREPKVFRICFASDGREVLCGLTWTEELADKTIRRLRPKYPHEELVLVQVDSAGGA